MVCKHPKDEVYEVGGGLIADDGEVHLRMECGVCGDRWYDRWEDPPKGVVEYYLALKEGKIRRVSGAGVGGRPWSLILLMPILFIGWILLGVGAFLEEIYFTLAGYEYNPTSLKWVKKEEA